MTIYSFWKIFKDKKIPFSHRLKILLFFFTRFREFINIFENVNRLYPYLRKTNFDIIFSAHSGWIFPLTFVLSRIFNKKIIVMGHGNDFLIRNPLSLKSYYFRNVDKIVVSNNLMGKYIKSIHHLNENQLEVINRGVNLEESEVHFSKEELRKKYNIPGDAFVILSVGRHDSRKKFDLVIKAISKINEIKQLPNVKYYLIGEGVETPKLKELTNELKLENQVEFLGSCSNEERNEFYKLSDLFIMPTITQPRKIEGFGIVFLEANYFKLPVIGTSSGGVKEAIIDGETGFLIKPNDLNSLVDKIIFLYNNKEIRANIGEIGYKRVLNEYTWDKIIKDYLNLFQEILKSKN